MEKSHEELGDDHRNEGYEFFKLGKYQEAIEEFEKAIEEYRQIKSGVFSRLVYCHLYLTINYLNLEDEINGEQNFKLANDILAHDMVGKVIHEEIQNLLGAVYFIKGNAFDKKEKFTDAIKNYTKALEYHEYSRKYLVYNNRGNVYYKLKSYDKAMQDYDDAIKSNKTNTTAYLNKAQAYYSKNEISNALQVLDDVINVDSDCAKRIV